MRRPGPRRGQLAFTALALVASAFAVTALIVACGGDEPTEPSVATTIDISPASLDLSSFGETVQLTATVRDQNGQPITGASVSWTMDDNSVATVSTGGLVTAVRNGSATVTATSGSATGAAAVTVLQRPARIGVSPSTVTFSALGDTVRLTAQPLDANGNEVADATVTWTSGDEAVATVDSGGLVTAAGNGTANITAAAGGATGAAGVTVSQVIVGMDVLPAATTLFSLGDTVRLVAAGIDANGHPGPVLAARWISENAAVAAVDSTGLVTAVRTGSTDIFATTGELRDSAGVSVAQLASDVRVTPAVDTLDAVGDTVRLSAVALDANGNEVEDTDYIWSAPHPAVVTVGEDGLVTAIGPGTGEIHVKATRAGANHIDVATITVLDSPGGDRQGSLTSKGDGATPTPWQRQPRSAIAVFPRPRRPWRPGVPSRRQGAEDPPIQLQLPTQAPLLPENRRTR